MNGHLPLPPEMELVKDMPTSSVEKVLTHYTDAILSVVAASGNEIYDLAAISLISLTSKRKKVSNSNRDLAIADIYNGLFLPRKDTAESLRRSSLHRELYIEAAANILRMKDPELVPQIRHLSIIMADMAKFRGLIWHRFEKMVHKRTGAHVWGRHNNGVFIDEKDTLQNFSMAVLKAIDRVDSNAGTLASSVSNWMQDAGHSPYSLVAGEAYALTRVGRARVASGDSHHSNRAYSLDLAETVVAEDDNEEVLSENVDPAIGLAVLSLATPTNIDRYRPLLWLMPINYQLSQEQLAQLDSTHSQSKG